MKAGVLYVSSQNNFFFFCMYITAVSPVSRTMPGSQQEK